jgi:uncharacterized protein (DUF2235 family)
MKRLVFCFDGTWNRLSADTPTNVVLTAASIVRDAHDATQIIHYDEGVGTGRLGEWSKTLDKYMGGVGGAGLTEIVRKAYAFLIFNYDPGDEIFVFGFSRGAFSARTFLGFIRYVGILRRLYAGRIDDAVELYKKRGDSDGSDDGMRRFRADYSSKVCIGDDDAWRCLNVNGYVTGTAPPLTIKYLGVWDTVRALGILDGARALFYPLPLPKSRKYRFHDPRLTDFVESARHAVAIDERRRTFPVELFGDLAELNRAKNSESDSPTAPYQERWFPGTHGSVGGGGDIRGLSDAALNWIIRGAKKAGLVLDRDADSRIHNFDPNPFARLSNMTEETGGFTYARLTDRVGPTHPWQVAKPALRRFHRPGAQLPEQADYRPPTLAQLFGELERWPVQDFMPSGEAVLTEHTVRLNETLSELAKRYYGKSSNALVERIFRANTDTLDDPDEIFQGDILRIPVPPPQP